MATKIGDVNTPSHIIIHHSLTKDSKTVSWEAIREYHKSLGWNDIGYHYGIELVGKYYEILFGRTSYVIGAHTRGMNSKSLGICCVGNFDLEPPPDELLHTLRRLVRYLLTFYKIPKTNVIGHSDYASYKSCPGNLFDIDKFRNSL